MKKVIVVMLIVAIMLSTFGCVRSVDVNGTEIKAYGLANKEDAVDGVQYKVSFRNALWSALFIETIVAPVLYVMFYIWVPVEAD